MEQLPDELVARLLVPRLAPWDVGSLHKTCRHSAGVARLAATALRVRTWAVALSFRTLRKFDRISAIELRVDLPEDAVTAADALREAASLPLLRSATITLDSWSDACCLDLLRTLAKCASGLQRVELRGCVASAGVVYALQPMTALQRLELNAGHRETDIELRCFEALPGLQELALDGAWHCWHRGSQPLSLGSNLTRLEMRDSSMPQEWSDERCEEIRQRLEIPVALRPQQLRSITLAGLPHLSGSRFDALIRQATQLTELRCLAPTGAPPAPRARSVENSASAWFGDAVRRVLRSAPGLAILHLTNEYVAVSEALWEALSQATSLRDLGLALGAVEAPLWDEASTAFEGNSAAMAPIKHVTSLTISAARWRLDAQRFASGFAPASVTALHLPAGVVPRLDEALAAVRRFAVLGHLTVDLGGIGAEAPEHLKLWRAALAGLKQLTRLDLTGGDAGFAESIPCAPRRALSTLVLSSGFAAWGELAAGLRANAPALQLLEVHDSCNVVAEDLAPLLRHPALQRVRLSRCAQVASPEVLHDLFATHGVPPAAVWQASGFQ